MIGQNFFARSTLAVARALLGQQLVRELDGQRLSGLIVETEAYIGPDDSACHAYKGRYSDRTQVMFGPPGRTYVYLIYGIYYMLNLVTEAENFPAAVLIRAIEPLAGADLMRTHRQQIQRPTMKQTNLTNGPGKLCQALKIDRTLNNWDITQARKLWLEPGDTISNTVIATGPRIGIDYARPEDRAAPWRFWIRNNRFVSK